MKKWILLGIIALVFVSGCVQEETSKIDFVFVNNLDHNISIVALENYNFNISRLQNDEYIQIELPSCSVCECTFAEEHGCAVCGQPASTLLNPEESYTYTWYKEEIIGKVGKYNNSCVYTQKVPVGDYKLKFEYYDRKDSKTYLMEKEFEITEGNQTIVIDIKRDIKFGQVYGVVHDPERDPCAQKLELLAKAAIYLNEECVASSGNYVRGELKFIFKDEDGNIVGTKTIIDPKQENMCITEEFSINESDLSVNITEVKAVAATLTYDDIITESKEFDTMLEGLCMPT